MRTGLSEALEKTILEAASELGRGASIDDIVNKTHELDRSWLKCDIRAGVKILRAERKL